MDTKADGVSLREFSNMRQNVRLLEAQIRNGHVDGQFLMQQVTHLQDLFERMEGELQEAKQGARFKALYDISRLLGASLDLNEVLQQVMDAVIQLTGADRGFLMLLDESETLEVKIARNLDQQTLDSSQFQYSRTVANDVLNRGAPLVSTNAVEDARFAEQASIMAQALRSIMAVPLRARGEVIGVAYVDSRVTSDLFNEHDLNALEALAGQAAIAIDNARLFEQTDQALSRRVAELTRLREIDLQLNETLNTDHAMNITLTAAGEAAGAVSGCLGLLEGEPPMPTLKQSYGVDVDKESLPENLTDLYPALPDVIAFGEAHTGIQDVHGAQRAVLILPIRRKENVLGVVVLHRADSAPYTDEEVDLVQRIANRAAVSIDNARLYAAVQAADRAKSDFVGIVAHDLKVPMTSIMGYAYLTQMIGEENGNFVEREHEFLGKIVDTVRRMEFMVSDLSDISRIEAGHFRMEPIRVSVRKIVEDVKDNTLLQIHERGHTFTEDIEPNLPDMYVDYYRLLQVLTNLISNAYKYTPNGGTITLSVSRKGERIRFVVRDTGIGLSKVQVAKLGTKFWRAEDEYTRSQPGTGLGFAITSMLVELMGSEIEITSERKVGSSFAFEVPTAEAIADPGATQLIEQVGEGD